MTLSQVNKPANAKIPIFMIVILRHCFFNQTGFYLKQISIPASITAIGDFAFYHCSELEDVSIPDSVTSIGKDAFSQCHKLILTVSSGSYAEQYCIDNGLNYTLVPAI